MNGTRQISLHPAITIFVPYSALEQASLPALYIPACPAADRACIVPAHINTFERCWLPNSSPAYVRFRLAGPITLKRRKKNISNNVNPSLRFAWFVRLELENSEQVHNVRVAGSPMWYTSASVIMTLSQ